MSGNILVEGVIRIEAFTFNLRTMPTIVILLKNVVTKWPAVQERTTRSFAAVPFI